MPIRRILSTIVFGVALASSPVSFAQETRLGIPIDSSCTATSPTIAADEAAVDAALSAAEARGYSGLSQHIDNLRAVAGHIPSCYPEFRYRDGNIVVRSEAAEEFSALTLALLADAAGRGEEIRVEAERNTYMLALMYLASHAVEFHRYDDANLWLASGLELQPNNQFLLFEKAAALIGQRRFADAAEHFQTMLDNPALSLTLNRARAYRGMGIALIDVPNKLDEADAALRESLTLDPNNELAQRELRYIAGLRRGAAERPSVLGAPLSERSNH